LSLTTLHQSDKLVASEAASLMGQIKSMMVMELPQAGGEPTAAQEQPHDHLAFSQTSNNG
jgi:hypothetical protein